MIADFITMYDTFCECNEEYFDCELPIPEFAQLHGPRTCGYFEYTKGGWFDKGVYSPVISITDYYDFTPRQFRDIMVHEMIHFYLALNGKDRNCHHGKQFKAMARQLNKNYRLRVTPTLDVSKYKKNPNRLNWWQRLFTSRRRSRLCNI